MAPSMVTGVNKGSGLLIYTCRLRIPTEDDTVSLTIPLNKNGYKKNPKV